MALRCPKPPALSWFARGMRGIVTDGGCRDSDEVILQRIPVYHRGSTRGIDPGRVIIESYNNPVNVGGVLVMPGDVVIADTEGVVVVPYEKTGRPLDFTVECRSVESHRWGQP